MISTFTAFFDANVFVGVRLRSLMMELAQTGLFRARWSEDIHKEWMQAAARRSSRGITVKDLEPTRRAMDEAVLDCLVNGYESLIPSLELPDPDDRHVLAAAITGHASVIVTFNLRDFPETVLAPFGVHARHPDDFLLDVESIDSECFLEAVARDRSHYRNPPVDIDGYIASLDKAQALKTAALLRSVKILLATAEAGKHGN